MITCFAPIFQFYFIQEYSLVYTVKKNLIISLAVHCA